jgi:hypothetical protein
VNEIAAAEAAVAVAQDLFGDRTKMKNAHTMEALLDASIRTMYTLVDAGHYLAASIVGEWCALSQNLSFNKDARVRLWFEVVTVALAGCDATRDSSLIRTGIVADCIRNMMKMLSCNEPGNKIPDYMKNITPITNVINRSLIVSGLVDKSTGTLKRCLNRIADNVSINLYAEWIKRKKADELDKPFSPRAIAATQLSKLRLSHGLHPFYKIKLNSSKWEDLMEMYPNDWEVVFRTGLARLHQAMMQRSWNHGELARGNISVMAIACLKRYQVLRIQDAEAEGNEMHGGTTRLSKRDLEMETWFNMGRAFHYMSINYLATSCYIKALAGEDAMTIDDVISMPEEDDAGRGSSAAFDLRRQAVHNLVLLLRVSPEEAVRASAQELIRQFLTLK